MTAKEFLNVMNKASDFDITLTPLIEKYGELLINESNKQTEIDITYKVLEPLLQLQEKCLQQMTWCNNGIDTMRAENIAEERIIDLKGQKEAYSDVFSAINNKVERLEYYLKHGNYGEF